MCRSFEGTFENTQRRKAKQMQRMQLCILSDRPFEETYENTKKCNQCDCASSRVDKFMIHLKSQTNKSKLRMAFSLRDIYLGSKMLKSSSEKKYALYSQSHLHRNEFSTECEHYSVSKYKPNTNTNIFSSKIITKYGYECIRFRNKNRIRIRMYSVQK